jgi:hypothetical protein
MPDPSASLDTAVLRKARGAFFTPEPLARYLTEWAVRDVAHTARGLMRSASCPAPVDRQMRTIDTGHAVIR